MKELLTEDQYNAPHPNPANSYGDTYGAHREYLEFDVNQHAELKAYCEEIGIVYSTSVWDTTSAKEIASLNPEYIKIPSACNNNYDMLGWLCDNYKGEIHISTGMTTKGEADELVNQHLHAILQKDPEIDTLLLACTHYPLLMDTISKHLPPQVKAISQGEIVANSFVCTLIFLDLPREFTVSDRLRRYYEKQEQAGWRMVLVNFVKPMLDPFDHKGPHI